MAESHVLVFFICKAEEAVLFSLKCSKEVLNVHNQLDLLLLFMRHGNIHQTTYSKNRLRSHQFANYIHSVWHQILITTPNFLHSAIDTYINC